MSALFSSILQCLYLASNHIDTAKPTVSSVSLLANMPTLLRLCKKVHTQTDSVPPTLLKVELPFTTSAALDDLKPLQPLN